MFISWKKGLSNSSNSVSSRVAGRGSRVAGHGQMARIPRPVKILYLS